MCRVELSGEIVKLTEILVLFGRDMVGSLPLLARVFVYTSCPPTQ